LDIDAVFLPTADLLINSVFPTPIVYRRHNEAVYDPLTGTMRYVLAGVAPTLADYQNADALCVTTAGGDYANSDVGDGITSLCVDGTLVAGTLDYDNADIDPRDALTIKEYTEHNINAGVLNRSRVEGGGTAETYELMLWVEHKTLPLLPTTADYVTYDGTTWKVTAVEPTYSSKGLIASKLRVRSN
jgi:hypothetical protein